MCRRNWFHYDLRVCTELQVLSKTAPRLWFYANKKYKIGNFARRTAWQRHIRPSITQDGSDNFSSRISGKLSTIATSNVIFSRTAHRIAAKFCMTIKKIKPNDIFQLCVHSFSTLKKWKMMPKSAKTRWSQKGWYNKPTNYNFNEFFTWKIWCSQNATNQSKSTVELGYMCPRVLFGPPAVTVTKKMKFKKILLLRCIHHFKSDIIINKMDHIRLSGTEPSSVILSQTM